MTSLPDSPPLPAQENGAPASPVVLGRDSRALAEAWLSAGFVFPALAFVLLAVVPSIVSPADPTAPARLFLPETVGACFPEPLEQARYVAALLTAPAAFLGALLLLRGRIADRPLFLLGIANQLATTAFLLAMWIAVRQVGDPFPRETIVAGLPRVGAVVAIWFLLRALSRRIERPFAAGLVARLPELLVAGWLAVEMTTLVTTENALASSGGLNLHHFPFWLGDFAAVASGRTPLVDFFPQYQTVLPWLALPFFRLFGVGTTVFSSFVAAISLVSVWLVYRALVVLCRDRATAMLLFAPFAGGLLADGAYRYYAGGPFRFTLPWVVLWLLARALDRPTPARVAWVAVVGGVAAVANFDFGIPALVAAAAALVLGRAIGPLRSALLAVGGFALALAAQTIVSLLRTGLWPRYDRALDFQRAFTVGGFFTQPMPDWGLHWILFAVLLAGLFVALADWRRGGDPDRERRIESGLLAFAALFGCGIGSYYVARSLPGNLAIVYPAVALVATLLVRRAVRNARHELRRWSRDERTLRWIPAAGLAAILVLMGTALPPLPSPRGELARLRSSVRREVEFRGRLRELTRRSASPGERVMLLHRSSTELARDAALDNVFPFSMPGSLILRSQLDIVLETIRLRQVRTILGSPPPSMVEAIEGAGFEKVDGLGDFGVWKRVETGRRPGS
jgi:hypothetical protein